MVRIWKSLSTGQHWEIEVDLQTFHTFSSWLYSTVFLCPSLLLINECSTDKSILLIYYSYASYDCFDCYFATELNNPDQSRTTVIRNNKAVRSERSRWIGVKCHLIRCIPVWYTTPLASCLYWLTWTSTGSNRSVKKE